jgi:hypothetical protein
MQHLFPLPEIIVIAPVWRFSVIFCAKISSTGSLGNLYPLRKRTAKKRKVTDKLILHRR